MPVTLELSTSSLSSPLESLKLEDQFESGTIFDNLSRVLDEVWFGPEFLQVHQLEIGNLWAVLEIDIRKWIFFKNSDSACIDQIRQNKETINTPDNSVETTFSMLQLFIKSFYRRLSLLYQIKSLHCLDQHYPQVVSSRHWRGQSKTSIWRCCNDNLWSHACNWGWVTLEYVVANLLIINSAGLLPVQ